VENRPADSRGRRGTWRRHPPAAAGRPQSGWRRRRHLPRIAVRPGDDPGQPAGLH